MSLKNRSWLFTAILVAFALRVYLLDAQSLWNDEGTSIALASLNLEAIIGGAARDIHPPLYYILLHYWLLLSGNSEFAARFLSVVAGVLLTALTFRIGDLLFDEEVGIIAAFFAAFSPLLIYYSQETRMYVGVALWAALAVWAMMVMLARTDGRRQTTDNRQQTTDKSIPRSTLRASRNTHSLAWLGFILANIAALYTHYFAVTLLLVQNLVFSIWWLVLVRNPNESFPSKFAIRNSQFAIRNSHPAIRNPQSAIGYWLFAQLVIVAAFLPWYLYAGNQLAAWPSISEPFDLLTLLWRVLNVFSVGLTLEGSTATIVAAAFGFLFIVGALGKTRELRERWGTVVVALWTLAPIALMYVVSLSRPAYNPKFLLLALLPFLILCARGLSPVHPGMFIRRPHPASRPSLKGYLFFAISIVAAIGFLPALQNYYYDPRYARDDYRAILAAINATARATDGILINAPGQADVVRYYNRRALALYPLPRMRPPDVAATRADVDAVLSRVERVYAIYWATEQSDPQRVVETKLAERAFPALDEWHGNVRLAVYGNAPQTRGELQTLNARVGDEIVLQDYRLDARQARAGDIVTLTLNWRAEQTPSSRYKVFVHLLDANNQVVAQRDAEPGANLKPTTTWRAGQVIADNYGILIAPGTPPGEYTIEIGLYRTEDGTRLLLRANDGAEIGDHVIVGKVRVE